MQFKIVVSLKSAGYPQDGDIHLEYKKDGTWAFDEGSKVEKGFRTILEAKERAKAVRSGR